jgi:ketosteroid isomerase-like protein
MMSEERRTKADTVRAMFDSYLKQDRGMAERLIADEFIFTSPQDDHIGRAAFFERCFPTANRLVRQDLLYVVPTDGDDVFVMYEYELKTGERHRNVELLTVRGDQITEAQVFFGGRYDV